MLNKETNKIIINSMYKKTIIYYNLKNRHVIYSKYLKIWSDQLQDLYLFDCSMYSYVTVVPRTRDRDHGRAGLVHLRRLHDQLDVYC